jgi:pyruvate formate lyase activating enzyme
MAAGTMMPGASSNRREAMLYRRLRGGRVRCDLCHRRCVMREGERGFCGTRLNEGGTLYTLAHGSLSCLESRAIEIKPFFHYWPGSTAMTFSTWSCNFSCPWCQNHDISRRRPTGREERAGAADVVSAALKRGDRGLCASFQEPTLQTEFSSEVFSAGREKGLYSCYVSNGYMTSEALAFLGESGMDAINMDLKGPPEVYREHCGGIEVGHVLRNIQLAGKLGMHLEVVNLVVTGINDDAGSIEWVIDQHLEHGGPRVPLHFTRYHPAHRYVEPPPPISVLEEAAEIATGKGVQYVYLGNVGSHRLGNTYCPECGRLLIERKGYGTTRFHIKEDHRCASCGEPVPIRGECVDGS